MAIETHGVTPGEVLGDLPMPTDGVTATSDGLSTTKIDRWITRAAGSLNAILLGRDMDPASLTDNWRETVRGAIIAYATAKSLDQRQLDSDQVWREYGSLKKTIREGQVDAGESIDAEASVRSNVDTTDTKSAPKWGAGWEP